MNLILQLTIAISLILITYGIIKWLWPDQVAKIISPHVYRHGQYSSINECSKCHTQLVSDDIFYSNGICSYCGHRGLNATTVTDHKVVKIRYFKPTNQWHKEAKWDRLNKELNGEK